MTMPLEDDDLLMVQRGENLFKTSYQQLKEQIAADLGLPFDSGEKLGSIEAPTS